MREQERNRVEAEIEAYEQEMSEIIYNSSEAEILEALGLIENPPKYDWTTNSLSYINGMSGEEQAEYLPPIENAYDDKDWSTEGLEF